MAESAIDKPKGVEKQTVSKQAEVQPGRIGQQAVSGAGAGAPPLDSAAVSRIQRSPQQALRSDLLALQRTVGNRAVSALVRGEAKDVAIQAKLEVGPVNDVYEQEADRVARLVTSGIAQRKPVANAKPRDEDGESDIIQPAPTLNIKRMVQRKQATSNVRADGSFTADANVQDRIRRMVNGGRPLPDTVRREMEPRFGADLGGVRIHTGGEAVQLSRDIGARAFTHGSHIAFGAGGFNPSSQEGRHLLAHELTHTIQQTGARPLAQRSPTHLSRRGPQSVIQRVSTWQRFKNFVSGSTPEPVMVEDVPGKPAEIQAAAKAKAEKALNDATALISAGKSAADQKMNGHNSVSGGMEEAEKTFNEGLMGKSAGGYGDSRAAIKGLSSGDQAQKKFLVKFKDDLDGIYKKIETNLALIMAVNDQINAPISIRSGFNYAEGRKGKALQSHAYAQEAEQLVESIRKQNDEMGTKADVEEAVARTGIDTRFAFNKPRSLQAAEKSASDSVLSLARMQSKIQDHLAYLSADLDVLTEYKISRGSDVENDFSSGASMRAMGSGVQRSETPGQHGLLDESQSYMTGGGSRNMKGISGGDDGQSKEAMRAAEYEAGKLQGQSTLESAKTKSNKPQPKSKLAKTEKKFAERVRQLEITSMLHARATKRVPVAKEAVEKINMLHDQGMKLYDEIDGMRKENKAPTQEITDQAIIKAGDAQQKVAQGGVLLEKTYRLKKEVYNESQNEMYKDVVGPRADSQGKRIAKKLGGIVAGAAVRALTGGLYSYVAEEQAGGYRVNITKRTIADDIARKNFELARITKGLMGGPVHGLGGAHGARAYVAFKGIAFALQIVRDIASAVALWVTIVTAGAGAPVGALFASIALFAAIAKGVIDLLLFGWSGAGLINTNDPRTRSVLRAENRNQMMAVGEGAFAGASAGVMMGVSGNQGLLEGTRQTTPFSQSSIGGQVGNVGVGPGIPVVGGLLANVGANNLSRYNPETTQEGRRLSEQVAQVRKAKRAMRIFANPINSAFSSLSDFMNKKKKLRDNQFAKVMPSLVKNIAGLDLSVQSMPEVEGSKSTAPMPPSRELESLPDVPEIMPGGPPSSSPISDSMSEESELV